MNTTLSFKDSLVTENSIRLGENADNWEDAIKVACKPLVESGAITNDYAEDIISMTKELDPYYILTDNMAMPHARPSDHVKRNAFSFVTLQEPVMFPKNKKVQVLVVLAATSSEIHVSVAIPQIIAVFEQKDIVEKILEINDPQEILDIIDKSDYEKYLFENEERIGD